MDRYHIDVFWSSEDGCWVANVPDLQFCSALGLTPAEAVQEVMKAEGAWLESARAHGDPIPEPRDYPKASVGG